jgi:hypothetical protein
MVSQVLELTPSMAGWYFAAPSTPRLLGREALPPPALHSPSIAPVDPVCLGYGADGRPRLASARPRIWFLA